MPANPDSRVSAREELLAEIKGRLESQVERWSTEADALRALEALVGDSCPHLCTDESCSAEGRRRIAEALAILRGERP